MTERPEAEGDLSEEELVEVIGEYVAHVCAKVANVGRLFPAMGGTDLEGVLDLPSQRDGDSAS